MKKYLLILGATTLLILLSGTTYYFAVQLPKKVMAENELEKAKLKAQTNQQEQESQAMLEKCLEEVESDYKRKVELNSVLSPTEEYPDARKWNNNSVSLDVENKYNDDRDFCLERYK